jgi:hypothetical protein
MGQAYPHSSCDFSSKLSPGFYRTGIFPASGYPTVDIPDPNSNTKLRKKIGAARASVNVSGAPFVRRRAREPSAFAVGDSVWPARGLQLTVQKLSF